MLDTITTMEPVMRDEEIESNTINLKNFKPGLETKKQREGVNQTLDCCLSAT